jgi:hypothetical protein
MLILTLILGLDCSKIPITPREMDYGVGSATLFLGRNLGNF